MAEAKYDWVLPYAATLNNLRSQYELNPEETQKQIDSLTKSLGSKFTDAVAAGIIKKPTVEEFEGTNETGPFKGKRITDMGIDFDKLPKMPKAPEGTYYFKVLEEGGWGGSKIRGDELGFVDDPNFGKLGIGLAQSPKDFADTYLPMLAVTIATLGIGGGIAAGAGLAAGSFGAAAVNAGVSTALGSAVTGKAPNALTLGTSLLGGALGSYIGGAAGLSSGTFGRSALNIAVNTGLRSAILGQKPTALGVGSSLLGSAFANAIKS